MFPNEAITRAWLDAKEVLLDGSRFTQATLDLWFAELEILSFENEKLIFTCPSKYKTGIINGKYLGDISEALEKILGFFPEVEVYYRDRETGEILEKHFIIGSPEISHESDKQSEENSVSGDQKALLSDKSSAPSFNFEYTFDNFIEGGSNTFARAACWAVAKNVAEAEEGVTASQYNPLFLYGPSGIGKTHLMYAISNKIKSEKPNAYIIYIKGEDFTNDLIESLSNQSMPQFREKYRQCDILMIDDIQFIASKVATQEEFFHTFNALYENEKQIIMTSDRPPREINDLEKRLVSRFEMGLLADIQPPDLELRIAIIKKKAEQGKVNIPDDVLTFLAENLRSNIRQIEGAIKKLSALSFLSGKEITIDLAKNLLLELLGGAEPVSVTVDKIFLCIYKKYGFKRDELVGTRRTRELAQARHIAVYLIRNITEMSLPNIGKIFGKDHSTIMASIANVEKKMVKDSMFAIEISELTKEIEKMGK
ncbi:MAG: chromosomal replication initiator protein DnaA [Clostridia bacterium]|nr:chromosomal replication initiator protein DnaA [Clostridia bacterium]